MGQKKNRRRAESKLHRKQRCGAARDARAALRAPPPDTPISRATAEAFTRHNLKIGVYAPGITVASVPLVLAINLSEREDRWEAFKSRADCIRWESNTKVDRVRAASADHHLLQEGKEFGAPAAIAVAGTSSKRNRCRACALSHILALREVENRNLTPALICEDDLILTMEGAMRRVPLPAFAAAVSVGHHSAMTTDEPVVYGGDEETEALVSVKTGGYKSSAAGYLIPTRAKAQQLRKRLEAALRKGLDAPLDGILFHPRLFADDETKRVYLTKEPLFSQDLTSFSSIEGRHYFRP